MTDERLRNLERRFKESGDPTDELAYLQEKVRQGGTLDWESYQRLAELDVDGAAGYLLARVERGDLEREKLELAAYCSHEPARVALGEEAPDLAKVVANREFRVRAVLALARRALPVSETVYDIPELRAAVEAAEQSVTRGRSDELHDLVASAFQASDLQSESDEDFLARHIVTQAVASVCADESPVGSRVSSSMFATRCLELGEELLGDRNLRDVLAQGVLSWVLDAD